MAQIVNDLPPDMVQNFKDSGIWSRLPNAGFTPDEVGRLELWTEEEYKVPIAIADQKAEGMIIDAVQVFNENPNAPPPLDEEEEVFPL